MCWRQYVYIWIASSLKLNLWIVHRNFTFRGTDLSLQWIILRLLSDVTVRSFWSTRPPHGWNGQGMQLSCSLALHELLRALAVRWSWTLCSYESQPYEDRSQGKDDAEICCTLLKKKKKKRLGLCAHLCPKKICDYFISKFALKHTLYYNSAQYCDPQLVHSGNNNILRQ